MLLLCSNLQLKFLLTLPYPSHEGNVSAVIYCYPCSKSISVLRESGPIEGYHDLYINSTLVLYSPETGNIFSERKRKEKMSLSISEALLDPDYLSLLRYVSFFSFSRLLADNLSHLPKVLI